MPISRSRRPVANSTGGEPNGNIRNGYLYNTDRVSYVAGSAELIPGRRTTTAATPLVGEWRFNGQTLTTINVHSTSRGGSDPLEGNNQPPGDAGDASRTAQAAGVKAYINSITSRPIPSSISRCWATGTASISSRRRLS